MTSTSAGAPGREHAAVGDAVRRGGDRREPRDRLLERQHVGHPLGEQPGREVGAAERQQVRAAVAAAGHHDGDCASSSRSRPVRVGDRRRARARTASRGPRRARGRGTRRAGRRRSSSAIVLHACDRGALVLGPLDRLDAQRPATRTRTSGRAGRRARRASASRSAGSRRRCARVRRAAASACRGTTASRRTGTSCRARSARPAGWPRTSGGSRARRRAAVSRELEAALPAVGRVRHQR